MRSASPASKLAGGRSFAALSRMVLNGVISGVAAAALGGLFGGNIPNPWLMLVLSVRFMAATGLREQWPDN